MSSSRFTDIWIHHFTIYCQCTYSYHCFLDAWWQLLHDLTPLLYRLTGLPILIVYVFLLHRSWFIWLLHAYSCIPITWLFFITDIDIPITGSVSCWYAMCGIPHLLFPFPVILFYAINKAQVLLSCDLYHVLTLYTLNIINITWGWGRLDGWLDLIWWMYWIHIVSPTAGDGSAAYQ